MLEESLELLKDMLIVDPSNRHIEKSLYVKIGKVLMKMEKYSEASKIFAKALKLDPSLRECQKLRSDCLYFTIWKDSDTKGNDLGEKGRFKFFDLNDDDEINLSCEKFEKSQPKVDELFKNRNYLECLKFVNEVILTTHSSHNLSLL